jgi:ubiquinone biosynthesis protein
VLGQLLTDEVGRAVSSRRRVIGSEAEAKEREQERAYNIRLALERLGPFYIKVGQILSTRPDLVPQSVINELEKLHDQVSIAPFSDFEPILADELGPDWKLRFLHVDTLQPLGAASLAQVYRVTLSDGTPAVIKIQRPGIRTIVLQDMAILRTAARLVGRTAPRFNAVIDVDSMLEIIFDAMEPELNFVAEARNMEMGRAAVQRFKHLAVPDVLLATPRVLVQSLAPGDSIRNADRSAFTVQERKAIGRDLLALMYRGYFIDRFFHADPHPGNIFVSPGEKAYLIDWGMVGRIDRRTSMLLVLVLLTLAQNDGYGLAKSWVEMGHATPWAEVPGFCLDMAALVPKIATASLEELNFGVTLTAVLKRSTKRGIQTSPVISILGKSFGNIEGSVRYLAPELSLVDVFQDELRGIMFDLVREFLSEEQAARTAIELMLGSTTVTGQVRDVLRDLSNRQFTLQTNEDGNYRDSRSTYRSPAAGWALRSLGAALWLYHRHKASRRKGHGCYDHHCPGYR